MKRTLLAVGVAVLASMMFIPTEQYSGIGVMMSVASGTIRPFFSLSKCACFAMWAPFALQTAFVAVAAAVIVNLFPRKPRK